MKIALYARQVDTENFPLIRELLKELHRHQCELYIYQPFLHRIKPLGSDIPPNTPFNSGSEIRGHIDFLLSLGGDGTILDTLTLVQDSNIPVMGINLGRLGFLTGVGIEDISGALEALM